METSDLLRHQKIKSHMAHHPKKIVDVAINLWEQMAIQIISIVGEGGFSSLYARCIFLTQSSYPWLAAGALSPQKDHRFAALKICLEEQSPAQVSAANSLLLITFTDILAELIGELLTNRILYSAWSNDTVDVSVKELKK